MEQISRPEERYYIPVKDKRPRGAQWKAILDDGKAKYYIQIGQEETPEWIELGMFYAVAFLDSSQSFINDCVTLYDRQLIKREVIKKLKDESVS